MARFLYRLGLGAFHRRLLVIALWGLVLVGAAVGSAVAPEAEDSATTMPGIESQQAYDLMAKRFPGAASDGATARIVFVAPDGERVTSAANRAVVDGTVAEAAGAGAVASAVGPFAAGAVSEDGGTAYATVTFKETANELTDAEKAPSRTRSTTPARAG